MKRAIALFTIFSVCILALPAFAGHGACTASTQDCLDSYCAKLANVGWAGFQGEYNEEAGTFTLTAVEPGSPAVKAGFEVGDVIHAWNGVEFASMNEDDWKTSEKERVPGSVSKYSLTRDGKEMTLAVTLGKMPEDMVAQKIGNHMMTHAQVASNEVQ
jgi:predicted metalloprotease with PDZ domain